MPEFIIIAEETAKHFAHEVNIMLTVINQIIISNILTNPQGVNYIPLYTLNIATSFVVYFIPRNPYILAILDGMRVHFLRIIINIFNSWTLLQCYAGTCIAQYVYDYDYDYGCGWA